MRDADPRNVGIFRRNPSTSVLLLLALSSTGTRRSIESREGRNNCINIALKARDVGDRTGT